MKCDDHSDGKQPDRSGDCVGASFASQDNFRHFKREPMRDHQGDVNDNETDKDDQTDEVQTAGCLVASKNSEKPREPCSQRR